MNKAKVSAVLEGGRVGNIMCLPTFGLVFSVPTEHKRGAPFTYKFGYYPCPALSSFFASDKLM